MQIQNEQILTLTRQGLSAEQVAQALELPIEAVRLIANSVATLNKRVSIKERFGDLEEVAINTLKEVCQYGENESARVRAAELLDTKYCSKVDIFDVDSIVQAMEKAKAASKVDYPTDEKDYSLNDDYNGSKALMNEINKNNIIEIGTASTSKLEEAFMI